MIKPFEGEVHMTTELHYDTVTACCVYDEVIGTPVMKEIFYKGIDVINIVSEDDYEKLVDEMYNWLEKEQYNEN